MPREATGAVGFAKETTYNTAVSPAHIFYATEARPSPAVDLFNENETANASNFSTGLTPLADMSRIRVPSVAHDETMAAFAAAAMGSDTVTVPTGATAANQHKIVPISISSELTSYTVQTSLTTKAETTLGKATRYSGCLVDTWTLSSDVRSKVTRTSIEFAASGSTSAGVDLSAASTPNFGPFRHNNVFCWIGTAYVPASLNLPVHTGTAEAPSGVEITGAVNWSTYIRGFSLTYKNNVDQEGGHSGSTGLNATSMFIGRPSCEISLNLRFLDTDSDQLALFTDGIGTWARTVGIYNWSPTKIEDVTTDYQYAYSLFLPSTKLKGLEVTSQNLGIREVNVTLECIDNLTQNVVELYVWNKDTTDWA